MGRARGVRDRVGPQIRETLASALLTRSRDPVLRQAVVTEVLVNADRSVARVYYIGLVEAVTREDLAAAFERSGGFLRREVSERLRHLRRTPELRFFYDEGVVQGRHMDNLLRDLVPGDEPGDDEPTTE